jgi:FkbM family methyltransferase
MKVLFVMRHSGYVRNFESTLRLLGERGHDVHLAFEGRTKYAQLDPAGIAAQMATASARFTYGDAPVRTDGWGLLGRELRLGVDYLRYLGPEYDGAPKLRERAERAAPPGLPEQARRRPWNSRVGRRAYVAWQRALNRVIPTDPAIDRFLEAQAPDVVAVTPLIEPGAPQSEYLRSAHRLGIRTAYCVASWDNLTNKGAIHGPVDLVTVWNDAMKREAVELHGMPASRVVVTGAAAFDHWFGWQPSRSRELFCAEVGLPADRPYLLYLCSSKFVGPGEARFVRTWLNTLRSGGDRRRRAGVLIRPHPQNAEQWRDVDVREFAPAVVWPAGEAPVDLRTRNDYFDSIYHSAAVIGLNTTAEIEAAIVGRSVYTVLADDYRGTQDGTLHFRHLRDAGGGVLHLARGMDEHMAQLEAALGAPAAPDPRLRTFVEAFIRPHGLDVPATPRLVDALERLAAQPAARGRDPLWAGYLRRRLEPRAAAMVRMAPSPRDAFAVERGGERPTARRAARGQARQPREATAREQARAVRREEETVQRQERINGIIEAYRHLGERDRRAVILNIVDAIPDSCFPALIAAARPARLDYDRADLYLQVTSKTEVFRVKACAKEPFTIQWIHDRFAEGDVFYDVGANVGAYSLVAAKQPGKAARVFSFEASYANVAALTANIALNAAADAITVLPVALAGTTAIGRFHLRDPLPGGARHALGAAPSGDGAPTFPQAVMTFRLDDLIAQLGLPAPTHIKLDVDGGELAVLDGATRTLASPTLATLLIEVATELSEDVTALIERGGLRLESRIVKRNKAGEYAVWYGVFSRRGPSGPVETVEFAEPAAAARAGGPE